MIHLAYVYTSSSGRRQDDAIPQVGIHLPDGQIPHCAASRLDPTKPGVQSSLHMLISSPHLILLLPQISQTQINPNSVAKMTFMNVQLTP
jgi:hypothetical protein